jgi:hypothetical protein
MEDAMAAEVDETADADGRMITEAGDGVININGVNITDPNRSFSRKNKWDTLGPEGRTTVLSMRDWTQGRGGCNGGGRDGGGRGQVSFQDGENERTISTAIIEYNANAPPATKDDDMVTDHRGRNGRGFGRGAYYGRQGRGRH